MTCGILALLTDFGHRDPYVGIMKGVILSIAPQARLVDLCHEVAPQDIVEGSLLLQSALDYFPPGTLFVAVVDPGVGGERRALAVRGERHLYVAPDNGLLALALRRDRMREARQILPGPYTLARISPTFHGRDVFAPVAAHLCRGVRLEDLGPPATDLVDLEMAANERQGRLLRTRVLHVDRFGNLVTGLHRSECPSPVEVRMAGVSLPLLETYSQAPPGAALALWGSSDHLEISVNRGNAQECLGAGRGTVVEVVFEE